MNGTTGRQAGSSPAGPRPEGMATEPRHSGHVPEGRGSSGGGRGATASAITAPSALRRVSFTVAGLPAPQGSKRAFANRHTGRVVVTEMAGEKLRDWRSDVRDAAYRAMLMHRDPITLADNSQIMSAVLNHPFTGPLGVSLAFTLPKPKSAPKNRRTWPDKRPDLDKLVRSTLDGLTGPVFADDAQVIALEAFKYYPGEGSFALDYPGVNLTVWQIGAD